MEWIYLVIAGLLEVGWATGMKYSENFTRLVPSIITVILMIASFWLLSLALKTLPVGTAYGIWTGIGAVGTAIVGILLFKEPATVGRILCLVLIVSGIVGLKLMSPQ